MKRAPQLDLAEIASRAFPLFGSRDWIVVPGDSLDALVRELELERNRTAAAIWALDDLVEDCGRETSRFYVAGLKVARKRVRAALAQEGNDQ